ncbi:hypothetical protein SRABI98_00618 [Microbacterium sp. Bi98]|uniref:ABC-three component system middle component 2 n=1 Tax=Microbacterium sp. Bi98 TaxID=2821116 RepID=UPI001D5ECD6E|nr:ABC-three component system middle component 2 [Microbacterium sp. Bi98]CAH0144219.1 hypothetical protein SRABI98_00618 [Microbacterium sp. Bi98]
MERAELSPTQTFEPDSQVFFRAAQLLLAFSVASELSIRLPTTERLAAYDFFTANPFAVLSKNDDADSRDSLRLELVGYARGQLSYASLGHRFVSRRERIRADLAVLVARGLVEIGEEAFMITDAGRNIADQLRSAYADAYRLAAEIVLVRLNRLSDRQLRESSAAWAGTHWLLLDLFDDVVHPEVGAQ